MRRTRPNFRLQTEHRDEEIDYVSLRRQYSDPGSLQSRKLRVVFSILPRGARLLDVGSGEGEWIDRALQKFDHVVGLEISQVAVDLLRERFKDNYRVEISGRTIVELSEMSGQTGTYDVVTMLDVMEHLSDVYVLLHSAYQLLRPGGIIVTTTPNWYDKLLIPITRNPFHLQAHSSVGWRRTVAFPVFASEAFCKYLHVLGICVVVQARKPPVGGGI